MKIAKRIFAVIMCALTLCTYGNFFASYAYMKDADLLECVEITETEKDGYINIDFNIDSSDFESSSTSEDELLCSELEVLPSAYNSKEEVSSPVKNQSGSSWCWAFTTSTVTELAASRMAGKNESFVFSPTHLAWFTYTPVSDPDDVHYGEYYVTSKNQYGTGGNWLRAAATFANFEGLNYEETYPFELNKALNEDSRYTSDSGYVMKDAVLLTSESKVKNWVMNYGGVFTSFYIAYKNYNYKTYSYYGTDSTVANHGVTIVGWDDDYDKNNFKTSPSNNGAWLCQNSYGTDYGENGYFWLSYEDASLSYDSSFAGFTVQENVFMNNYSYNNVAYNRYFEVSKATTFANVFTAKSSKEAIESVVIASVSNNTNANIKVYTGVVNKPDSGKLVTDFNTVLSDKGYHTVELPEKIHLNQGEKFSVVVTFSGNGIIGIPTEYANSTSVVVTANAGESFIKSGTIWKDMIDYSNQNYRNLYIQALTVFDCVHTYEAETVPSSCQKAGYERIYCTECGTVLNCTELPILPHNLRTEISNSTCGSDGYERTYCLDCNTEIFRTVIACTEHSFESITAKPTCTNSGYTTHICNCGYSYTDEYTDPIGHNWVDYDWRIDTSGPTIDHEDGKTIYYKQFCTHCGKTKIVEQSKNFWQRLVWFFTNLFNR